MLALQVKLNGKRLTTAGAEDLGVLSCNVVLTGKLGSKTVQWHKGRGTDLMIAVGGVTARPHGVDDGHLYWLNHRRLKVGDSVAVRIVKAARTDPVVSRSPSGRKSPSASGREF